MKKTIYKIFVLALALSFAGVAAAQASKDVIATFRSVVSVEMPSIKVPTVLEVPLSGVSYDLHVGVYDKTASAFVPHLVIGGNVKAAVPENISTTYGDKSTVNYISDGNFATFTQFDLPETSQGKVALTYKYANPIRSNSMLLSLDHYVALPTSLTIKAMVNGTEKIVLANTRPTDNTISFLETVSDTWIVEISYAQPLRVSEMTIENRNVSTAGSQVRFLAEPEHSYDIYTNPETILYVDVGESGNLSNNLGIAKAKASANKTNPAYKEADSDADGIVDMRDNCVRTSNEGQEDTDQNGRGDACDDFDRDGVMNSTDNCVNKPNQNQTDTDGDDKGDSCDGEESRLTEKYPVLVWFGIGFAVLMFGAMFYMTMRKHNSNSNDQAVPPAAQ